MTGFLPLAVVEGNWRVVDERKDDPLPPQTGGQFGLVGTKARNPDADPADFDFVETNCGYADYSHLDLVDVMCAQCGYVAMLEHISEVEFEVLLRLKRGKSMKEIAIESGRSTKTIERHKANAMRKLTRAGYKNIIIGQILNARHRGSDDLRDK